MNKSIILLLTLTLGTGTTLCAETLGTPPSFNSKARVQNLSDGQSIVIGKYHSRQDADNKLSSLLDFMDGSSKIVNLELAHGFDYAVKEEGGEYIVSIEPFTETKVLNDVLSVVHKAYPQAHAEVCKDCIRGTQSSALEQNDQDDEALENAVALQESNTPIPIKVEEDEEETPQVTQSSMLPFKQEYIFYGVGALALLILIFLVIRKPKKKSSDRELKEMYAQAKKLEEELKIEDEIDHDVIDVEEVVEAEEVVLKQSKVETPKPQPQAKPEVKEEPKVEQPKVEEPIIVEAKPTSMGGLSHKLREPNKAVGTITKENFKEFEGLRLLIAEDNLINQKVIVGLLKGSGINIMIANDGQECMDILAEDPNYPIILMDAHMPRIDGLEATRLIRANPAYDHITVMALSGDTGADDIRKMRECGMEEQLEKPLKIAALYQAIYCYFDPNALGEGEELPEIHLDNSLGLEMLGGDIELYNEILAEFQSLYKDSDDKIELWIKHGDYNKAKALLLDVKGIGESIGTAELTDTAEEFREALIAGESAKYDGLMNRYRSQLQSILADIAEV